LRELKNSREPIHQSIAFAPTTEIEMRFLATALLALAALPMSSNAQETSQLAASGPTIQAASAGFRVSTPKVDESTKSTAAPLIPRHQGQDVALMAVGVGAMIAGALIGGTAGTIIVIGGAAMGLFGLYHYLD
jgi:hypothetical protein